MVKNEVQSEKQAKFSERTNKSKPDSKVADSRENSAGQKFPEERVCQIFVEEPRSHQSMNTNLLTSLKLYPQILAYTLKCQSLGLHVPHEQKCVWAC